MGVFLAIYIYISISIYYFDLFGLEGLVVDLSSAWHSDGLEPLSFEGAPKALRMKLLLKSLCQRQKRWERKLDLSKNWRCKIPALSPLLLSQPYWINPQAVLVSLLQRFEFKAKEPSRRIPVKSNVNTCDMLKRFKKHRFYKDNARRETIQVSHIFILSMSRCRPQRGNTKIW